jgi:WD40 repeat protein
MAAHPAFVAAVLLLGAAGAADKGLAGGAATQPVTTQPVAVLDVDKLQPEGLIGDPRFRHPEEIREIQVIDQGRAILTAGWSGHVCIWDAATGNQLAHYELPQGLPPVVGALTNGKRLVACYLGGQPALVIDRRTGEVVRAFKEAKTTTASFVGPVIVPGQEQIFAAQIDGGISLWNLETGEVATSWLAHKNSATNDLALSPDGKTLVSAGWGQDASIAIWDAATGKLRHRVADEPVRLGAPLEMTSLAFAPQGQTFASAAGKLLRLWDAEQGKEIWNALLPDSGVQGQFSPDGVTLAVTCRGGQLHLFRAKDGKACLSLDAQGPKPFMAYARPFAFSADSQSVFIGVANTVCRYDSKTGARQFPPAELGDSVAFGDVLRMAQSPAGGRMYTLEFAPRVLAWDLLQRRVTDSWALGPGQDNPTSLCLSSDGRRLLVGTPHNGAGVLKVEAGQCVVAFPAPPNPQSTDWWFWTRGEQAVACIGRCAAPTIYDMKGVESSPAANPTEENAWPMSTTTASSDGQRAAVTNGATRVKVWDVPRGTLLAELDLKPAGFSNAYFGAFLPNRPLLLLGDGSGKLCLWDYTPARDSHATPEQLARWVRELGAEAYPAREEAMAKLMECGPGAEDALAKADGNEPEVMERAGKIRRVWTLQVPKDHIVGSVLEFKEGMVHPVLHPDGKHWAATIGWPASEIVLGEITPEGLHELRRLSDVHNPCSLVFSADGKTLFAGNANATISVWRVAE